VVPPPTSSYSRPIRATTPSPTSSPGQDKISLDYQAFDPNVPNDFANWLATHATVSDVLIDLNVDGLHPGFDTILLKNIATANLHAGDFIVHSGGGPVII
jgi:hypothetical protein